MMEVKQVTLFELLGEYTRLDVRIEEEATAEYLIAFESQQVRLDSRQIQELWSLLSEAKALVKALRATLPAREDS
jgi:hypothetical protein